MRKFVWLRESYPPLSCERSLIGKRTASWSSHHCLLALAHVKLSLLLCFLLKDSIERNRDSKDETLVNVYNGPNPETTMFYIGPRNGHRAHIIDSQVWAVGSDLRWLTTVRRDEMPPGTSHWLSRERCSGGGGSTRTGRPCILSVPFDMALKVMGVSLDMDLWIQSSWAL